MWGRYDLMQLLYTPEIASGLPNDAKRVGQMEMNESQNVLRVDEASENFWNSNE